MKRPSRNAQNRPRSTLMRALLIATALQGGVVISLPSMAMAQQQSFDIAAQPLTSALRSFARQSGLQISVEAGTAAGARASAVQGQMSPAQALDQLLRGTGISHHITPEGVAVLGAPLQSSGHATPEGAVNLDPVVLGGGGGVGFDGTAAGVYEAAGDVDFISGASLNRLPVTSPSDIFRGTTGVLSGDARSSGALNVNIRGMQGQGRVPVTVDGAQNTATAYRGYQGNSDRSYIDPDLIGAVAVQKGPSSSQNGVAGSVSVSTITASDVLLPNRDSGFRLRLGQSGNTTAPQASKNQLTTGSGTSQTNPLRQSADVDRPSLLEPTGGSTSLVWATKKDWGEVVAGYAYRRQGNYHAGTNGPSASYSWQSCRGIEGVTMCPSRPMQWGNDGISSYFAGEEVLNSSTENRSGLLKLGLNINEDLRWNLAYSALETEFGESFTRYRVFPGDLESQRALSRTRLKSLSSELKYRPATNDLIDLNWQLWATDLESQSASSAVTAKLRPTSLNLMWGSTLSNTSRLTLNGGELKLNYGLSYQVEDTEPDEATRKVAGVSFGPGVANPNQDDGPLRDARRAEWAAWISGDWQINDRWAVTGGLRYSHAELEDRLTPSYKGGVKRAENITSSSIAPSIGTRYDLTDDLQLFASYSTAYRHPSLLETSIAYGVTRHSDPRAEQSRNLDLGMNWHGHSVVAQDDSLGLKLGYFNNSVKDYIARGWDFDPKNMANSRGLYFYNMDKAKFSGLYLTADYAKGGFNLGVSATLYDKVEFCPTADACANSTSWADFASNHIPPKFQLAVDVSQKFMEDRLTLGARATHIGKRAATTAGSPPTNIFNLRMSMGVDWKPHTILDLYGSYDVSEQAAINFGIQNVTDQYYFDPMVTGRTPAPGRTAHVALDVKF